jgi:HTH-type transcriptional regulator/antitoxin HigA
MASRTNARPQAIAPGRILRRELEARGWTQKDLAGIMKRPAQAITEIVAGTKAITPETACDLGAALGTSPEFWLNLEAAYRLALTSPSAKREAITRRAAIYEQVPVAAMVRAGWIPPFKSVERLEEVVREFLGVEKLGDEPQLPVRLRHSGSGGERAAQRAWVRRAEAVLLEQPSPARYSKRALAKAIPAVRSLARDAADVARVPGVLRDLGVRFAVVPQLPGSKLDGVAMFTSAGPGVALTLRYDRIDYFWFTLFHELAHLVCGHEAGHLDAESAEVDNEEREANALAAEWLLAPAHVRTWAASHAGRITPHAIDTFAAAHGVHPGLVVGRLQHEGILGFDRFRSRLVSVRDLLPR